MMSVSYVASSDTVYMVADSVSATIPTVQDGDLLIACVMYRGTATAPDGWEFVASEVISYLSNPQYTAIYKRRALSSDSGDPATWVLGGSVTCGLQISAYRSGDLCDIVSYNTFSRDNVTTSSNTCPMAVVSAIADGEMVVAAASNVLALNQPTTTQMNVSANYTRTSPSPAQQNRMGICYRAVSAPFVVAGQFSTNVSPSQQNGWAAVTLLLSNIPPPRRRRIPLIIN